MTFQRANADNDRRYAVLDAQKADIGGGMSVDHMAAHGDGDHRHAPVGFQQAVDQIGALDLIAHMGQKAVFLTDLTQIVQMEA